MSYTIKMKPEIKAQWVAALRSDEYEQGGGRLLDEQGRRCCLGVLADLAVKAGAQPAPTLRDDNLGPAYLTLDPDGEEVLDGGVTPSFTQEWAGLPAQNPMVVIGNRDNDRSSLAELNDNGVPFAELANIIEEQL